MKKVFLLLIFLGGAGCEYQLENVKNNQQSGEEKWECIDYVNDFYFDIIVKATVDESRKSGIIEVAGVKHSSAFAIKGFGRRWDFGLQDGKYDYAFIIQPDGTGLYYDFTIESKTEQRLTMKCRQSQ